MSTSTARSAEDEPPSFDAVSQAVLGYFAAQEGYEPGDLISRSQVEAALDLVEQVGWDVPDRKQVAALALSDNSFLIKVLSTKRGQRFMRQVGHQPNGFSYLDRLSSIDNGHNVIKQLIDAKDGYLMIEYMATTKGGHNLGRMMADVKHGVNLNKLTDRIYTADELVELLAVLYAEEFS